MARLEKIWISEGLEGRRDLRLDWSNDRHHAVTIFHPGGPEQIGDAIRSLARLVYGDPNLYPPNTVLSGAATQQPKRHADEPRPPRIRG
jgi:hypothetical protein